MASKSQIPTQDKRILARLVRERGPQFEQELRATLENLPDLQDRVLQRSEDDAETFSRELTTEKDLREQRIARQLESSSQPPPQAELLPGDTRD